MEKWADYAITGVKHEFRHGHGAIIEVESRADNGNALASPERVARLRVVNAIRRGVTFVTAYRNGDKWERGADVRVIEIHGEYFLRTDRDRIRADNLGELPELP